MTSGTARSRRRDRHTFVNASRLRALEDDSGCTGRDWRRDTLTVATRRLNQPTEIPNQTDERGEERDLRGTMAARVLEFHTAALSVGQRREKPAFRGVVRVRQASNQISPRMRQCLGLSQAVGDHLELGRAVRFEYHPKQYERAQGDDPRDDGLITDLGREAAKERKLGGRSAAAVGAELSVGEFQARWLRNSPKGRVNGLDNRASLGNGGETSEAEVVGHCHHRVER